MPSSSSSSSSGGGSFASSFRSDAASHHRPGLHHTDTPLISPRPRSWSAARRATGDDDDDDRGGLDSPAAVERLLRLFDEAGAAEGSPAEGDQGRSNGNGHDGDEADDDDGQSSTPSGWPGSFGSAHASADQHAVSTASGSSSDPRSSAYTQALSNPPPLDSPPPTSPSSSPSTRPPSPSPSSAAHEILRTLAAMAARPAEIDTAPFSGDVPSGELQRRQLDAGGLSAVEERTEERTTVGGSSVGEWLARASDHRPSSVNGSSASAPHAPPPSPAFDTAPASPISGGAPLDDSRPASLRRAHTPSEANTFPSQPSAVRSSPPRAHSSSPTKRERALGNGNGSRSAASLIALFEGAASPGAAAPSSSQQPAERKSAPLLFAGSAAPLPPVAFNGSTVPSRLADRRSYLSPVAPTASLPAPAPGRRSVFDLPQFQRRSTSPASPPRTSRLGLGLFPLRSLVAPTAGDGKGKARALSDTDGDEGSSPLEALTPQPMGEAELPPLPPTSSSSPPAAGAPDAHAAGQRKPIRLHGRTWTDVASPLVRRGAFLVRSLSAARGRGRKRANSAPPVAGDDALGEAREMRDAVEEGFSWRPDDGADEHGASRQATPFQDENESAPAVERRTRHTLYDPRQTIYDSAPTIYDTTPSSSVLLSIGHARTASPAASASSALGGRSPFTTLRGSVSIAASVRSFDPALERDLERSSTISTVARTDVTGVDSDTGGDDRVGGPDAADDDDDDGRFRAGPGPPAPSDPSSSSGTSSFLAGPPQSPSVPSTSRTTTADVRSTATETAGSSAAHRLSHDFPSDLRGGVPDAQLPTYVSTSVSDVASHPVDRVDGILSDDIGKLLLYLQRQEQWRIGRDALQANQLEHIQQDVLTVRAALGGGGSNGPPIPPKDPPPPPSSSSGSPTSSSTARPPSNPADGGLAPILELLERVAEAEQAVLARQDDIAHQLAEDSRRRRDEREARAAETSGKNITLHRLDDLLRRVLWLLGDEVFHGEGGPPTEEESIYGPDVRPLPSHAPASIRDLANDDESHTWERDSSESFVSRGTWHSSQHGVAQLANPPPSKDSAASASSQWMFPDASARSFPASSPSFSSLPPRSPASGHQSQLDEADRRWDEIRRNRSLPRRPYSAASSASTVRPPAQLPAELDDALEELARRARELQERERRLDDDEFRVRENAAAQAQWLADQTDRLGEEEDRLWQAAEDEIAAAYHNIGRGGHEGGALQPYDGASQLSDQDEPSRVYGHPANERDVYRRPLPPPEPLDLPTAVHDHGGPLPPDFDRRTGPSQPYPEDIYYPRHGYARPAFPGARPPLTQTFYPGASRSAFDVQAGYGPSSARSRPGFFGSLFPRRQDTSYGYSTSGPGGFYPPTPPYGRGSAWMGGYPSLGGSSHRRDSSTSSPTTSDDTQRRTTRHVNNVTDRVNDLQREVNDLRDGRTAAPTSALNASSRLPAQTTAGTQGAPGQPSNAAGNTFFTGHPATHSRRSSGSDHQQPVNVTINAPPQAQAPPPPQIPRPASPPGLFGTLKDLAGPALGGVAGAMLGDRHGHKAEEKENREERKEDRKAALEDRKAAAEDRRADLKAAASAKPGVLPVPAPVAQSVPAPAGASVIIPPPGAGASAVETAATSLPARPVVPLVAANLPVVDAGGQTAHRPAVLAAVPTVPQAPAAAGPALVVPAPATGAATIQTDLTAATRPAAPSAAANVPSADAAGRTTASRPAVLTTAPTFKPAAAPAGPSVVVPPSAAGDPVVGTTSTAALARPAAPPAVASNVPAASAVGATPARLAVLTTAPPQPQVPLTTAGPAVVVPAPGTNVAATDSAPAGISARPPVPKISSTVPVVDAAGRTVPRPTAVQPALVTGVAAADPSRPSVPTSAATLPGTVAAPAPAVTTTANVPSAPAAPPILPTAPQPSSGPAANGLPVQSSTTAAANTPSGKPVVLPGTQQPAGSAAPSNPSSVPGGRPAVLPGGQKPASSATKAADGSLGQPAGRPVVPGGSTSAQNKTASTSEDVVRPQVPPSTTAPKSILRRGPRSPSVLTTPAPLAPKPAVVLAGAETASDKKASSALPPAGTVSSPAAAAVDAANRPPSGAAVSAVDGRPLPAPPRPAASDPFKVEGRADGKAAAPADASSRPALAAPSPSSKPAVATAANVGTDGKGPAPTDAPSRPPLPAVPGTTAIKPGVLHPAAQGASPDGQPARAGETSSRPLAPAIPGAALAKSSAPEAVAAGAGPDGKPSTGVAFAPGPSSSKAAESPMAADVKRLLDEMAQAKTEQQALFKTMAAEIDKQKKEQLALLANLGADMDKNKKEQQALLKALGTDVDKSVKAAQKASTDEMKKTAKEQVTFNVNAHLDQFSKSLAGEVKTLMKEVGDLREAKRALQHEIADLLLIKARHGAGDGMNLFPWQGPKPAAKPAATATATKPAAAATAPKPAAQPTAGVPPWWAMYNPQAFAQPTAPVAATAPAAPVLPITATPRPPVAGPPASVATQQQAPVFIPPWAMYSQQPPT